MSKPLTMGLRHHEVIFSIVRKNLHPWINGLCLEANDASAERRTVIYVSRGIAVHATHRDLFIAYTEKKKKVWLQAEIINECRRICHKQWKCAKP